MTKIDKTLLVAILGMSLSACAGQSHVEEPDVLDSPGAELEEASVVLGELRTSRFADEAQGGITRAERWLRAVESDIAEGDADEWTRSLMTAARAQIAAIKALYARLEAERAEDRALDDFAAGETSIRRLEEENFELSTGERR